jgi:hypothetical protein
MRIFYRISESSNPEHESRRTWQKKFKNASKRDCLLNVMSVFKNSPITVFVDNVTNETWEWLHTLPNISIVKITAGSEAKSIRELIDHAILLDDSEIVLFQEDDYLYLPGSETAIQEILEYVDYATCYLHPDKFWHPSEGGNPYTPDDNISEMTQVIKTDSHFWMLTNSTTVTFATRVKTIKEDYDIWMWGTEDLIGTKDFATFIKLRERGRYLAQPIPSLSTHCLVGYEAPLTGLNISSWEDL